MTKQQINLILHFCKKNQFEYLQKIFRYIYFYEIIHFQNTGKRFSNFTFVADQKFPIVKELWDSISTGQFEERYSDKFKIYCPNRNRVSGYMIGDIRSMKIVSLTEKFDEDLRWTELQINLMNNLKFKFDNAVPSQMTEIYATSTNFWINIIKSGEIGQIINFENLIPIKNK